MFPKHLQRLPLGIVINTGQPDKRRITRMYRGNRLLNQIEALANSDNLTELGSSAVGPYAESETLLSERSI